VDEPERILLVDDERSFRDATASILRDAGYACDCAADAEQATAVLERGTYDAVVTDLRMSGNAALEFLVRTAQSWPELPVIVVTGYPSLSTAIRALQLAASDYVIKPVEPSDLLRSVARAVRSGQARRRLREIGGQLSSYAQVLLGGAEADEDRAAEASIDLVHVLSEREREVAGGIANGVRVEALAGRLGISERTVRNHLQACFRKLGVHSQVELAVLVRTRAGAIHQMLPAREHYGSSG